MLQPPIAAILGLVLVHGYNQIEPAIQPVKRAFPVSTVQQ